MYTMQIPYEMDPEFLRKLAGITQPWGSGPGNDYDTREIAFDAAKLPQIMQALDDYAEKRLTARRAERLEELANLRREKEQKGPNGLVLDDKTAARLTAATVGLLVDTSKQSVRWEVTRGVFQVFPRETVLGLAVAAVNHVQSCFDNVADKTELLLAATHLDELEAIDLTTGWPDAPVPPQEEEPEDPPADPQDPPAEPEEPEEPSEDEPEDPPVGPETPPVDPEEPNPEDPDAPEEP